MQKHILSMMARLRKNTSERGTIRELRRVFKTVALLPQGPTTGRGQKPRRSPKGRSASPGTRPGVASSGRPRGEGQSDLGGPKRRGGSDRHGQRRAEGTNPGIVRGWSSYALAPGLTNRHLAGSYEDRAVFLNSRARPFPPRTLVVPRSADGASVPAWRGR